MSEEATAVEATSEPVTIPNMNPVEAEAPAGPSFQDIVPAEYADKPWVKDVKDIVGMFKMTDGLKSEMGKRPGGIPQENASDEERAAFNKALGVPDSVDGYELSDPAEGGGDFQNQMKDIMLKAGVPAGMAKQLDEGYNEIMKGLQPDPEAQDAEFTKMATNMFGDRTDAVLADVKSLMADNVHESMKEEVNNLPNKYLVTLASVLDSVKQKYINEDDLPRGQGNANAGPTASEKQARRMEIISLPAFKDKSNPQHKALYAEWNSLYN